QVAAPNRVVYVGAFESGVDGVAIDADLEYLLTLDGLHQNVLLRGPLPDPKALGLDPEQVRLEVWSEILAGPVPKVNPVVVWAELDPAVRAQLAEPDWIDDFLDFGSMFMPL